MQRYRFVIEPDQRRGVQFIAAALFAVTLVVAGLVVALRSETNKSVDASTNSPATTTAVTDPGVFVPTSTSTSPRPTTTVRAATTSTKPDAAKELKCAHTTDSAATPEPSDWATYWQTEPGPNEPLKLLVCVDDVTPAAGQEIVMSVMAEDKDAKIGTGDCDVHVDWDGAAGGSLCRDAVVVTQSPQPTPPREPGRIQVTYRHTYTHTGDSMIDVSVWSGPADGKRYPYNSYNNIELPIAVHK